MQIKLLLYIVYVNVIYIKSFIQVVANIGKVGSYVCYVIKYVNFMQIVWPTC